ncbi:hypothetical protein Tco_1043374 [Tanacetum coccineum]|uniref:Integrase, catalytic region, zinc finger, CCHC-type, peptidase aspartic, catalytic n=1 Tax=Tanacetum coccineum TaxID=301880 RepID=A0ABQ5GMT1_9ASTR
MLAPKCPTFNGIPTFVNPMYLKKAQYEKPCLYEIPHDQSDPTNRLVPDREEILTLEEESRSKLINDLVKPYDYTKHGSEVFLFVHELKQEMHADLKYVESLEKEIDELESDKAEFSNMYDMLLQECVSNDVMCSYLHSLSDLDSHTELQCLFLHKVKECECLAQKLLKQTKFVSKEVYTELLRSFAKFEKHSISLELALQQCMYRIDTQTTQTRAPQLPQTSRNTNPRVSTSTGVNHRTIVSRPQLKSNKMNEKVMPNTSQVKFKKTKVEDHHRISSISNQSKSVAACNDRLKSRTSNVNAVCATCGKCVFNSNHDACISKYLNDVNARTKKPKNSKSYYRMLYENTSKAWKWWIEQQCPSGYKWVPKTKMKWVPKVRNENVKKRVSFAIENASRITNVLKRHKYDLVQRNITINRVYYVEGLNHNLFSVGQFCDVDLEVAFWKSTYFVRDLQGNDLLTSNRGSDLYTISLQETTSPTLICLMAKAHQLKHGYGIEDFLILASDYIN